MHSKIDNIEIMIYDKAKLAKKFLNHVLKYIKLKTSIKYSSFIFDCVHLFYYKCHQKKLNHGRSYIVSPNLI